MSLACGTCCSFRHLGPLYAGYQHRRLLPAHNAPEALFLLSAYACAGERIIRYTGPKPKKFCFIFFKLYFFNNVSAAQCSRTSNIAFLHAICQASSRGILSLFSFSHVRQRQRAAIVVNLPTRILAVTPSPLSALPYTFRLLFFSFPPSCVFVQVKGKAAIDVLGARLGKSGGALAQQGLVVVCGSILTGAPVLATLFGLVRNFFFFSVFTGERVQQNLFRALTSGGERRGHCPLRHDAGR